VTPLAIILVLELVFTTFVIGRSSQPKISPVLGTHNLAQAEESPIPTPEAESPAPEASPAPPAESSTAPAPAEQTPELVAASPTPELNPIEASVNQTQAVLSPDDLINSSENINNQSITEAKKEDEQVAQTTDPVTQSQLLINFAADKVKDMSRFTKADDFASANFAAQRFNDQMDQAISNLDKVPPQQQGQLKAKLVNFCDQADLTLRTVQLSVPEQSEPDVEIARGQCGELSL